AAMGVSVIVSTLIAFFVGFGFRLTAQTLGWEEWEPWEPEPLTVGEKARKTLGEGLQTELDRNGGGS
ncbi:MAG TPA: hypothetical protein VGM99_05930, partial [Candidatus Cybelea sp.]